MVLGRGFVLALTITPILNSSCRTISAPPSKAKSSPSDNSPLSAYEVVDCTPKLCGQDVSIVGLNPNDEDLTALGVHGEASRLSLDESTTVDDVRGTSAESAMDKASATNSVLKSTLTGGNNSKATRVGLTGLFGSLSTILNESGRLASFARDNIIAKTEADRSKTLAKVTSFTMKVKSTLGGKDGIDIAKLGKVLETLKDISGDDGWINRGDLPRFLPVIPNIVGKVADEKISQGYAEGIANLARTRPFAYRRWVRMPNGIIGSIVQRNVNSELNAAYSQKYAAIQQASNGFQQAYNGFMDHFGIEAFYLNVTDGKNYYDPGKPVEEEQINQLTQTILGKSLDEIVRAAADNPQNVKMSGIESGAAAELADEVELTDGIPIADIEQLVKETQGFTTPAYPKGLSFELLDNGKLRIKKNKSLSEMKSEVEKSNMKSDTKPFYDSPSTITCSGTTVVDRSNNTIFYLYSSVQGSSIELQTPGAFFNMSWVMDPQTGWPLIRGGYAHYSWRQQAEAVMRITLLDGTTAMCTGPVAHQ